MKSLSFLFLLGSTLLVTGILGTDKILDLSQIDKSPVSLSEYFEVYEDSSAELTLAEVQKPEIGNRFKGEHESTSALSFGLTHCAYWLRLTLQNSNDVPVERMIEISHATLSKIQFHQPIQNGGYQLLTTGYALPFSTKPYPNRNFVFPITLPAKSQFVYYLRIESHDGILIPAKIWTPQAFHPYERNDYLGQAWYFGMVTAMILFNFLLFLTLKDAIYLFYVSFIACMALSIASTNGLAKEFLWQNASDWSDISHFVLNSLAFPSFILFMRRMLDTKKVIPKIDLFLKFLIAVFLLSIIGFTLSLQTFAKPAVLLNLVTPPITLVIIIMRIFKRQRSAYLLVAAYIMLIIGGVSMFLRALGFLPSNVFTINGLQIGSAIEMVLLAFALADRFNEIKKERVRDQRALLEAQSESMANQRLAIRNLEKADKLKDEFLANTSHELRTPLNGIIGIAESLMDGVVGNLPSKANENLSLIIASGKRLSNLISDILDFSKLKHKDLQIYLQPVDIYSITNLVLKLSEPFVKNKNLKLINEIPETIPAVLADENRLQQIFYNVIGNAIKFTEEGSVTVKAELVDVNSICVGVEYIQPLHGYIQITVTDTGIGIPADKLESIFEYFEQVDASNTREYGGTGLGLSVTKQLIELQGGRIWAESEDKKGSRFIFTLPATQEKPHNLTEYLNPLHKQGDETVKLGDNTDNVYSTEADQNANAFTTKTDFKTNAYHILVVDDEPVNLQVISNHFTFRGYRVTTASSGKEALRILEMEKPDIVLLDVMMPMMTGYEVSELIREKYDINQLPIIFLTAKNRASDLLDGFGAKGNDYIIKPFSKDELLSRVRTHIQLKEKTEELVILNQNLEQKVMVRTEQLNEMLDQVGKLYVDSENKRKEIEVLAESRKRLSLVGQMAAGIVHDIKNPMATIRVMAELANSEKISRQSREKNLKIIVKEMDRLSDLVYEILDFSKGEIKLDLKEISLKKFISEIGEFLETSFKYANIQYIENFQYEGNVTIDKDRMRRVIVNLAKNAIEAMQDGKREYTFTIRMDKQEDKIRISLIDNGHGIPESVEQRIFQAFSTEGKTKGTGLGLFMSKWIVEAHNGTLTYETKQGEGTKFFIELPISERNKDHE